MFLVVHAAVGALAGNAVDRHPAAAFALGVISHFFADMIPHGDENMYEGYKNGTKVTRALLYVGLDALATAALIVFIFTRPDLFAAPLSVAMGVLGGLMPDVMVAIVELIKPKNDRWFSRKLNWYHKFHMRNHHFLIGKFRKEERDIPLRYGLAIQGVVFTILMRLIL